MEQEFKKAYDLILAENPNTPLELLAYLPSNPVFQMLSDKIATQWLVDGFDYGNKILARYVRASKFAGGIDEILSAGLVQHRDYNEKTDWTNDIFVSEQYRVWARLVYEDNYHETIYHAQAQQAFLNAGEFGSFIGLIMKRFEDTKKVVWFERMKEIYNLYPMSITLEADENNPEAIFQEMTYHMSKMRQPSTAYNVAGKMNATPYEKQQLTWNTKYLNQAQWITSRLFKQDNISNINKVIWGDDIDFNDDTIVAILDTADTIYLGIKFQMFNYEPIARWNRIEYYRSEFWTVAVVPFANGIIFKTASSGAQKVKLDTVITEKNITITELTPEAVITGAKTANSSFEATENERGYLMTFDQETKKGTARINASPSSKYLGFVDVNFTLNGTAGSSNFGR